MYHYGEIYAISDIVPRFLKNGFHIPEERHLGLASLSLSLIPWVYVNDSMGLCHLYRGFMQLILCIYVIQEFHGFISLVPWVYVIGSMDLSLTLWIYAIYSMDLCH